jgi:hypothetical protein
MARPFFPIKREHVTGKNRLISILPSILHGV